MTTPIFNPIWFYLIELAEKLNYIFAFLAAVAIIATLTLLILKFIFSDEEDDIIHKFKIKPFIIIASILIIISTLIPSKETCYAMIVTSYITPENIESVKGETSDLIDYIIEQIDKLNDDNNKKSD